MSKDKFAEGVKEAWGGEEFDKWMASNPGEFQKVVDAMFKLGNGNGDKDLDEEEF